MIQISQLTKKFGKYEALKDLNLFIPQGKIYGIIGENGAGKSTLLRCLTGIYKPDSGQITLNGESVYDNPAAKSQIGYVADSNQFFPYYTVEAMVRFFMGIYPSFSQEKFVNMNKIFQLPLKRRIAHLSKGAQMRLSFMLACATQPKVLVLDEPTNGLDVLAKNQLFQMLIQEVEENQTSIVISTHQLNELEKICDNLAILHNGHLLQDTDINNLRRQIRKFQVVFRDRQAVADHLPAILSYEHMGSIHYYIAEDREGAFVDILKSHGAEIVEEIPMSLEELFIHSLKEKHYV